MRAPRIPDNEAERLAALHVYDVLDTAAERVFDDLVSLASHICGTPIALVSLVDTDRQWFKAKVGLDAAQTPRDVSFCGHVVADDRMLVVPDALEDARFADNPLVAGAPNVRFYAGAPLVTPSGFTLGTLCVIDHEARDMTALQREMLEALSRQVVSQLELRLQIRRQADAQPQRRLFFEKSLDLLCVAGFDGYFKTLNPAFSDLLGWSEDEMLSRPFTTFVHEDDVETTNAETAKLATGFHETVGFVNRFATKDGVYKWINWTAAIDADLEVMLAAGRDVTADKQKSHQLEEARREAEAANVAKSVFLANMSHELRTPLNSVIGFTNIMARNKPANLTDRDLGFLERIGANGKHLLSLLNDILDLSKIESGRLELESESFALAGVLAEVMSHTEGAAVESNVALSWQADGTTEPLHGDRRRFKQILVNLVSNAVKFASGGTVNVYVHQMDGRPVRIDVRDTGIGIPPDKIDSIFEAFRQADSGTARQFGGTGLGLTISQALCQAMGFTIEVDSVEQLGSTFSIRLADDAPRLVHQSPTHSPGTNPQLRADDATQATDAGQRTLLVVDDDPEARLVMQQYVEDLGYRVIAVDSGERAIDLAKLVMPAAITLDLMMPDMDGMAVLRSLRDDPATREIPVIVSSIVGGENRVHFTKDVQIVDKPVDRNALERALARVTESGSGLVLVIDDEEDARVLMTEIVSEMGHRVRTASNGADGLASVDQERPDLIVLDLMMPVVDGFGFLEQLRSQPEHRHLPVILCTAKDLSPAERTVLKGSVSGVLGKSGLMAQRVRDLIEKHLEEV